MKKQERKIALREYARTKVMNISKTAQLISVGAIGIDDGSCYSIIFEDKKRLYLCETFIINNEMNCNLRIFMEV